MLRVRGGFSVGLRKVSDNSNLLLKKKLNTIAILWYSDYKIFCLRGCLRWTKNEKFFRYQDQSHWKTMRRKKNRKFEKRGSWEQSCRSRSKRFPFSRRVNSEIENTHLGSLPGFVTLKDIWKLCGQQIDSWREFTMKTYFVVGLYWINSSVLEYFDCSIKEFYKTSLIESRAFSHRKNEICFQKCCKFLKSCAFSRFDKSIDKDHVASWHEVK